VLNYPARGIGKSTEEKLIFAASLHETSIWEVLKDPVKFGLNLNSGARQKLTDFAMLIQGFQLDVNKCDAFELGSRIASSTGLLRHLYEDRTPEGISRYDNIQELLNGIKEFTLSRQDEADFDPGMGEFLQDVALLTDADKEENKEDRNRVSLMTVHMAKGLEFPNVFIVGLEENLFPSQLSLNSRSDLEEERRLFYVALTRAMERAVLTYSLSRFKWGNLTYCEPSRFIEELDGSFIENKVRKPSFTSDRESYSPKTYRVDPPRPKRTENMIKVNSGPSAEISDEVKAILSELQTGATVSHEKFGEGVVLELEGNGFNQKATIEFTNVGRKQLLLRFAKLKLL
jgi:DNA helicase-2/ATP-dependent DNA helicase PcrA